MCEIPSAKVVTFPPPRQENSPVHRLVYGWWQLPQVPALFSVSLFREHLYAAALNEIRMLSGSGRVYDPNCDFRFKWACQWLEIGDASRRAIDPEISAMANFLFGGPPSPCGKDKAAGETQTLALG